MQASKRISQLDGLRGIFALMVLLLHFPIPESFLTNNFIVRQSYLFVDFFFVLSGYIIAANYLDKINNLQNFKIYLTKRFIRLYPLLLYTVLTYFLYLVIGEYFLATLKQSHRTIESYLYELLDTLLFLNSTPLLGTTQGINPPSWSISSEMISYIFFGIGLLLFRKRFLAFCICIIFCCIYFMIRSNSYVFNNGDYGFVRGLLGFNCGVLVYLLFSQEIKFKLNVFEVPIISLLLLGFYTVDTYKVELFKLVFPVIFSLFLIIFSSSDGIFARILNSLLIQFLGRISYSLYLNHYLILSAFYIIFFRVLGLSMVEPIPTILLFLVILLTVLYSFLTYLFIETKVGNFFKKLLKLYR